jgi:hypothetical protein
MPLCVDDDQHHQAFDRRRSVRQREQWTHPVPHTPRTEGEDDQCDRESSGHTPCHTLPAQKKQEKTVSNAARNVTVHNGSVYAAAIAKKKEEKKGCSQKRLQ